MSRFDYYLTEKLDLNIPIKVIANNAYTWQAHFKVDGVKFNFVADWDDDPLDDSDEDTNTWGITFWNLAEPGRFTQGSTELTGTMGTKSLKVFSGVASAFKKFIQAKKPEGFFFSAEEPSRIKLYNRLAKMMSKKFGYKLKNYRQEGDSFYEFTRS